MKLKRLAMDAIEQNFCSKEICCDKADVAGSENSKEDPEVTADYHHCSNSHFLAQCKSTSKSSDNPV